MVDGIKETASIGAMLPVYKKNASNHGKVEAPDGQVKDLDSSGKTKETNPYAGRSADEDPKLSSDMTAKRIVIEEGTVVFEHYDEKGRLVQKVPPGYVPLNEMA